MTGPCKQSITISCKGDEVCLNGYVSNHKYTQAEGHPYTLESLKVRLPFTQVSMMAKELEIEGKRYQVVNAAGYPAANRTTLDAARATLENCNTVTMQLYGLDEIDGCAPGFDPQLTHSSVDVLLWHEKSSIVDTYDTRGFDQLWRLYIDHSTAKALSGTSYFLSGEDQYKVREVVGVDRLAQLPYALCEINRWVMAK